MTVTGFEDLIPTDQERAARYMGYLVRLRRAVRRPLQDAMDDDRFVDYIIHKLGRLEMAEETILVLTSIQNESRR